MKIIEFIPTAQNTTHLPQEIIDVVVRHIQHTTDLSRTQKALWCCCLVSRDWYAVAVKHLYRVPLLTTRNFPEFARTISPPVTAKTRRIGLEDLVEVLDMGMLAYESKKSTTSRLISRTKSSLIGFTAPAVTFASNCLAPLSKCSKLKYLDLSRDDYGIDLDQLVKATRVIPSLISLSLPRDSIFRGSFAVGANFKILTLPDFWPSHLEHLQINDAHFEPTGWQWHYLLTSLPSSLRSLAIRHASSWDAFDNIAVIKSEVSQIETLSIHVLRADETYYLNQVTVQFPNVTRLVVPGITTWICKNFIVMATGDSWSVSSDMNNGLKPPQLLQVLVLEHSPDFISSSHIRCEDLRHFVSHCPRLLRIELPEDYLNLDEGENESFDQLNEDLSRRYQELEKDCELSIRVSEAGIYMVASSQTSAVGLKRSVRYRGQMVGN